MVGVPINFIAFVGRAKERMRFFVANRFAMRPTCGLFLQNIAHWYECTPSLFGPSPLEVI